MDTSIRTGMPVVLAVGERYHLRRGKDHIIYGGMPSDGVYSIVEMKASGYQGYAWHLYYPKKRQEITIDGVRVSIERVTPEEIEIRV